MRQSGGSFSRSAASTKVVSKRCCPPSWSKLEDPRSLDAARLPVVWYSLRGRAPCCRVTMNIDDLNRSVTNAIVRAESLSAGSREVWEAFHEVSALEEFIAAITPSDDLEGEIARLG